jgi:hypothetical protein
MSGRAGGRGADAEGVRGEDGRWRQGANCGIIICERRPPYRRQNAAKRGELLLTANMAANPVGPRAGLITSLLPGQRSTFLRFAGALLIA